MAESSAAQRRRAQVNIATVVVLLILVVAATFLFLRQGETTVEAPAAGEAAQSLTVGTTTAEHTVIVYEDFLPVSAAGIFQSNLGDGAQQEFVASPNQQRFETDLGAKVLNEFDHYAGIEQASIDECLSRLSRRPAAQ